MSKYFITGTGTDIGKTFVTSLLVKNLGQKNKMIGIKPIAAGIEVDHSLNNDVTSLLKSSNSLLTGEDINFYTFKKAVSPHIGAEEEKVNVDFEFIKNKIDILADQFDHILIEGVGGLMSPVDNSRTNLDLIKYLHVPVILIVGLKLGCINEALLTLEALQSHNIQIKGWIANEVDSKMLEINKNIEYLKKNIDCPLIEIIQHQSKQTKAPRFEGFKKLINTI
jgi:dethiobiotin synthetase